jgi:ubiquinone/menaquinone biosynthesis C-methylase UbiE
MPIFDHFGFFAPFYDRVFQHGDRAWLFDLLKLPAEGRLLDAGGGTGRIAQLLRDQISQVVVADLSLEMLQQANSKTGLLTTCSHAELFPFRDDTFDRILMVDALHHVCDQAETAHELWRVLKPGGRLVIEEPDFRTFGVKMLAIAEKLLAMRSHFLAPEDIAALFIDPCAQVSIKKNEDNFNAWIVVDKPAA